MHIALMWPDYWPYIRRGTERMTHDIARFLLDQGHSIDIITTKPGNPCVVSRGRLRVIYQRQISHPVLVKYRMVPRFDGYGITSIGPLMATRYDLIHLMFYTAAPVVRLVQRWYGTPFIYHVQMIPPHWNRLGDEQLFRLAIAHASEIRSLSQYCDDALRERYGRGGVVVPPTVDINAFTPARRARSPRILFAADLTAPSKGARLLALAFNEVFRVRPNVVLQFAGPTHPQVDAALLSLIAQEARPNVQMLGPGTLATLRTLYAEASTLVLPSYDEPFGMVLTEALASGTPVVGTRSGGIPEIITDPAIGTLFDLEGGDPHAIARRLAEAILHTLDLAEDPATAARCREHAARWAWPALGPAFLELQQRALGGKTSASERNAEIAALV